MALPANWNSSTIDVDPWVLHDSAANLTTAAQGILDDLSAIITALNSLKLSWVGDSSDDATAATDRWNSVMADLYGTEQDASTGILNVLTGGLEYAAVNYSQCEQQVYDMFDKFESGVTAPSTSGDNSAPTSKDNVTDIPYPVAPTPYYHTTSVNETF